MRPLPDRRCFLLGPQRVTWWFLLEPDNLWRMQVPFIGLEDLQDLEKLP
jgi:hypothetical protein